ncbi:hypothetical protein [Nonomuraea recticatena]|uniref:Uncharacterized protein n=1 Tax=Nonomuraea recticatena TaxID=46178 RepID=A0ABN3T2C5_9ACTN
MLTLAKSPAAPVAPTVAAILTGHAAQLAADLLADLGWVEAAVAMDGELLLLIDEAIATGEIRLCEVCHARVTADTVSHSYSGEVIAVCEDCGTH